MLEDISSFVHLQVHLILVGMEAKTFRALLRTTERRHSTATASDTEDGFIHTMLKIS